MTDPLEPLGGDKRRAGLWREADPDFVTRPGTVSTNRGELRGGHER